MIQNIYYLLWIVFHYICYLVNFVKLSLKLYNFLSKSGLYIKKITLKKYLPNFILIGPLDS